MRANCKMQHLGPSPLTSGERYATFWRLVGLPRDPISPASDESVGFAEAVSLRRKHAVTKDAPRRR